MSRRPLAMAGLAGLGLVISTYLACFQLGLIGRVWDPFFDGGSERVLSSDVSRLLPIPDALVGSIAYAAEAVLAVVIAARVSHVRALTVTLVVLTAVGAAAGLVLAVLQPITAHAFCTLCLGSSLISILLAVGATLEARSSSGFSLGARARREVGR